MVGKFANQEIYVVQRLYQQLLGRPAIEALGLVARVGTITSNTPSRVVQSPWETQPNVYHQTPTGGPLSASRGGLPFLSLSQ